MRENSAVILTRVEKARNIQLARQGKAKFALGNLESINFANPMTQD
jgi:predicted ATPase with chaperone activity